VSLTGRDGSTSFSRMEIAGNRRFLWPGNFPRVARHEQEALCFSGRKGGAEVPSSVQGCVTREKLDSRAPALRPNPEPSGRGAMANARRSYGTARSTSTLERPAASPGTGAGIPAANDPPRNWPKREPGLPDGLTRRWPAREHQMRDLQEWMGEHQHHGDLCRLRTAKGRERPRRRRFLLGHRGRTRSTSGSRVCGRRRLPAVCHPHRERRRSPPADVAERHRVAPR
jgi:hypothetical protein